MPASTPDASDVAARERVKWDAYYAGLGEATETPALRAFGVEFAGVLGELLPAGGSVLEAGCGAGFQSLALARDGRLSVSMMDISAEALDAARRLFARSGLTADTQLGDAFSRGTPAHDLVFNAGVLEHYTLGQQADFLCGMASRSRRYVLVLVPNRLCYWYWVWRVQQAGRGHWPYGKECPQVDLSAAFTAAGLNYLGHTFVGGEWTEDLLTYVQGLSEELRNEVLTVHRSKAIDDSSRCYLIAALGCVGEPPAPPPPRWSRDHGSGDHRVAELTAALADSLALRVGMEAEFRAARHALRETTAKLEHTQAARALAENLAAMDATALTSFRTSAAYKWAERVLKVKGVLAPPGSVRAAVGRSAVGLLKAVTRPFRRGSKLPTTPPLGWDAVRERVAASGLRPVVFLPSVPWNLVLFQRPQHLAREIARLGHVVVYDTTGAGEPDPRGVREVEPNVFVYYGDPKHPAALPNPVVWAFSYNYHQADAYPPAARVYDWIDDLAVFPHDPKLLTRNHERAVKEAGVVASVARRLHEQLLPARPDAVYLPNAAEAERFADPNITPADDPDLRQLLARSKAVAGYYGALAAWFDYPLLKAVAKRLPDWAFVLIGPDYDESIRSAGLDHCPNVKWLGPRHYSTLPGYLRRFDVATIPFVINDITLATSPLKLFEYFAGGVPVVTTPMPECMAFPEVRIADTAEGFAAALTAARADGESAAVRERLRELGRANTWTARAKQVMDVVAGVNRPPG